MLALRIRPHPAAGDATPEGWTEETRDGWTASIRASAPYGFRVPWERGWICGESAGPIAQDRVVAAARRGPDVVLPDELLGLVVVDVEARRLVVASSVRGGRAWYVHAAGGTVTLATRLSTLADLGVRLEADEARYPELLVYRFVAPPNTPCRDVRQLVAGEVLTLDLDPGHAARSRLATFPDPGREMRDEAEDLARLRGALVDDIRLESAERRRTDALLSGGLDSSLLTALAKPTIPGMDTWSSGFGFLESGDAEARYARSMAEALGVPHHEHRSTAEAFLESLVRGTEAAQAPLHHLQSGMLHLLFAEAAASGCDALLCGEGADSLFGTDVQAWLWKHRRLVPWLGRLGISPAVRAGLKLTGSDSERWSWFALGYGRDLDDPYHLLWTLGAYGNTTRVQEALGCTREAVLGGRPALYATYGDLALPQQVAIAGLLLEASVTMRIWGALAEDSGIALVCPFTSPRVVDQVVRMPLERRLRERKHLVRALLRGEGVPDALIERPKLSFGLPYRHWATPDALFQPLVDLAGQTFDPALLRSFQTERWDEAMILWSAIGLALWKTLVVDGADPDALVDEVLARHRARLARRS